jgi:Domain of unknown function (DUF932)
MHRALATRFGRNVNTLRANQPLTDDQIRAVAPSIFAAEKHVSRSERYTYIPTVDVLTGLRREGFEPFMVAQSRVRDEAMREHTKHMVRLRHAGQINTDSANEIVLINSHNGSSAYQMIAGMYRFVCANGLVCGDTSADFRAKHKGDIVQAVIGGAYEVLDGFTRIVEERESMRALTLNADEQRLFAHAALSLRYEVTDSVPAPVTESQVLQAKRGADTSNDLWTTFNRVQESLVRGGLESRGANGRRSTTRAVAGIDQNVKLNRALWMLASGMRELRSAS